MNEGFLNNRISRQFKRLEARGEKGLITYITAGDPDLEMTEKLALAMEDAGADFIELGVPFSDPLADGPVIQRASLRALNSGTSLADIFDLVAKLRRVTEIPLVLMTYYNPVMQFGLKDFAEKAGVCGVDGVIVADLPFDESEALRRELDTRSIALVLLAAPTSSEQRLREIGKHSRGFVYCVSLTGVTGVRDQLPSYIEHYLSKAREYCSLPLAIGFGISNPEQARFLSRYGDAVIVGSAIVNLVEQYLLEPDVLVEKVKDMVSGLKQALKRG